MATIKSGYSGKLAGFPLLGPRRKHDKRTDVQEVNFESLFGSDEFQVGTQIVGSGDVDGFDRFDPTNDGANPGISLAANTPLVFQATNGSIGLEQILLHVKEPTAAVPEPKWPDVVASGWKAKLELNREAGKLLFCINRTAFFRLAPQHSIKDFVVFNLAGPLLFQLNTTKTQTKNARG